jgi:Caspase domain/Glucodextranase, domain B
MLISKRIVTLAALAALSLAACPALAQRTGAAAQTNDETGSYFLAEKNVTLVVEADAGKGDASAEPVLRLRWPNNETRVLRKVSGRRYRFLLERSTNFVTFRADRQNPAETEMHLETPQGSYVLKRVRPAAAGAANKPAAKDTEPPQITITSPDVGRGLKAVATSLSRVTVTGRAADASGVNDVFVQGSPARLDGRGNFTAEVLLKVGDNEIKVEAIDIKGNRGTSAFTLRRQALAASPAPPPGPAPDAGSARNSTEADAVAPAAAGRFYALVIGINDYKSLPRLKTAEADAQSVAKMLRERFGFQVELLLNATRQQIVGALNRYRRELDSSSNLLVYYAGHGYFDRAVEKAYWLPVNATLQDNADWISADDVTVNVKGIPARHVLVVSDSCYSGTIVRGVTPRAAPPAVRERYLRRMLEGRSRTLIASGGNEPVADGGEGGHSVFATALLRGLAQTERDAFTAEELFYSYIRESVAGRSDQTPEYNPLRNSGHESGDFVFFRKK